LPLESFIGCSSSHYHIARSKNENAMPVPENFGKLLPLQKKIYINELC